MVCALYSIGMRFCWKRHKGNFVASIKHGKLDMIMSTVRKLSLITGTVNEVGDMKCECAHIHLNLEYMQPCILVCSSCQCFCKIRCRFVNMNHTDSILLRVVILSLMKYLCSPKEPLSEVNNEPASVFQSYKSL